jgi:hypothetical protein
MRVPVDVTEDNFPQGNVIYVLGGLLDPQNPDDFCTSIFPRVSTDRLLLKKQAIEFAEQDYTAEVYAINTETGEAIKVTNRLEGSAFPDRYQADYLKKHSINPFHELLWESYNVLDHGDEKERLDMLKKLESVFQQMGTPSSICS